MKNYFMQLSFFICQHSYITWTDQMDQILGNEIIKILHFFKLKRLTTVLTSLHFNLLQTKMPDEAAP